jgi:carboxyl-terminal processing protease
LVQTTRKLKYNTSIKVTTAKYYIPSGRCIQAIDYANRDKNGKVSKTPDSLLTEFKTQNGRIVLDGAGIKPDMQVEKEDYASITRALASNHMIFRFATQFVLKHDSITTAANFRISEEDYKAFLTFVDTTEYNYITGSGKLLERLEKKALKDGILNNIQSEISGIEGKLKAQKKAKLLEHKEQIKRLIEMEIATRYYFQKGRIQNRLGGDSDVEEALSLLLDKKKYDFVLSGSK